MALKEQTDNLKRDSEADDKWSDGKFLAEILLNQ